MNFIDFEYDGHYLSDYEFIVCDFDYSSGIAVVGAGSQITFDKVTRNRGKKYSLVNSTYDECITATFDICKNPEIYTTDKEMVITNDEYRDLMRWLNRRDFNPFRLIPDDCDSDVERETCYYNASFNIEKIMYADELIGLRLTMESDKPFGYGQEVSATWTFTSANTFKIIADQSDEIGYTYPDLVITVQSDGDLTIHNELLDRSMVIKNCTYGEVITISGYEQMISTSISSHNVMNDFNFEFLRIGNTLEERNNKITSSLPCKMIISYKPIIKDAP